MAHIFRFHICIGKTNDTNIKKSVGENGQYIAYIYLTCLA